MKLETLEYVEFEGEAAEWKIEGLALGDTNLLVGKNASGKTRTLNLIRGLAQMLAGDIKVVFSSGKCIAVLNEKETRIEYTLEYRDRKVVREEFERNGQQLLERGVGGVGKIFAEKLNSFIEFQTPEDELAAVARRDAIQHSFFEPLSEWGKSYRHYAFGGGLGRDSAIVVVKGKTDDLDVRDAERVVAIFKMGDKTLGPPFKSAIMTDMRTIGYPLKDIGTKTPTKLQIQGPFPADSVQQLYVEEVDLRSVTEQSQMSQGMFRALSILIQINYSWLASRPSCVLIDDIGEGLDFERSCALIEVLMEKAKQGPFQLIMSTNDRFVMNKVPLEAWQVLQRTGGTCRVFNYANSKAIFDRFKFTGLNNFDFFAMNFLEEQDRADEKVGDLR